MLLELGLRRSGCSVVLGKGIFFRVGLLLLVFFFRRGEGLWDYDESYVAFFQKVSLKDTHT